MNDEEGKDKGTSSTPSQTPPFLDIYRNCTEGNDLGILEPSE